MPGADESPLGPRDWAIILIVCATAIFTQTIDSDTITYRTTPPNQPLVKIERDYFDNDTFATLKQCATRNALLGSNPLEEAFSATRGLIVRYTRDGLADLARDEHLRCFEAFARTVMRPTANAFVLNVVEAKPSETEPIRYHIDQSFPVKFALGHYVAETVSVLYVSVPDDMRGGELEVRKVPDVYLDAHGLKARAAVARDGGQVEAADVKPVENTLVTFRGDAHHRVRPFSTEKPGARRVSLVLEQYRLESWFTALRVKRFSLQPTKAAEDPPGYG